MQTHPKRILLKISGEVLKGKEPSGICAKTMQTIVHGIKSLMSQGLEVSLVVGGGNYFRGRDADSLGIPRTPADQMGMLATLMNGIALQQAFIAAGVPAALMSGLPCSAAESYNWAGAKEALEQKKLLIFAGGTGSPYFTTDTAAALRAAEIEADLLMKATKVDGVYSKDPIRFSDAKKLKKATYEEVLDQNLEVMDQTAFALCRSNQIPILIFNMDLLMGKVPPIRELIESGSIVS